MKFIKKFFINNSHFLLIIALWQIFLAIIFIFSPAAIPLRSGYLGPDGWSNFDGVHYLKIAKEGYFQYGEAFFPLYPLIINWSGKLFPSAPIHIWARVISIAAFGISLAIIGKICRYHKINPRPVWWLLVSFPTAFYFSSVYTESVYLCLATAAYYMAIRKRWVLASLFGFLVSATKVYGILILIPLIGEYIKSNRKLKVDFAWLFLVPAGLLAYMVYQYNRTGDMLVFLHVQPAFGANRSGSELILLPQVAWRYLKIIFLAFGQPTMVSYMVSIFEFITVIFSLTVLYAGWVRKFHWYLLAYSLSVIIVPTLTGTFSSMPRYVLSAFPIFLVLGRYLNNSWLGVWIAISLLLQVIATALFLRGYFIA